MENRCPPLCFVVATNPRAPKSGPKARLSTIAEPDGAADGAADAAEAAEATEGARLRWLCHRSTELRPQSGLSLRREAVLGALLYLKSFAQV